MKDMSKKTMIICISIALASLVCGLVCAIVRGFDLVTSIMFGFIVAFTIVVCVTIWHELVARRISEESKTEKE